GGEAVLLQQVRDDVEVHVVAQARRSVPRHRRRDLGEERAQIFSGELPREALIAERGARAAAEIGAVTAGARRVVPRRAARRLRVGVDAVGDRLPALLRARDHEDTKKKNKDNEELSVPKNTVSR